STVASAADPSRANRRTRGFRTLASTLTMSDPQSIAFIAWVIRLDLVNLSRSPPDRTRVPEAASFSIPMGSWSNFCSVRQMSADDERRGDRGVRQVVDFLRVARGLRTHARIATSDVLVNQIDGALFFPS